MILPNWLFIAVVLIPSLISAGFLVWIILKTIPRGNSSTAHSIRGCAGLFLFMFLTLACVASLTCAVPKATVVMAGPDKDHSTKAIIFSVPESFKKKYGIADFTMGRSYVVNTTDRNMLLYNVRYCTNPLLTPDTDHKVIEIPTGKCTYVEVGCMPDFFFTEPEYIRIDSDENDIQDRWILDYSPINP